MDVVVFDLRIARAFWDLYSMLSGIIYAATQFHELRLMELTNDPDSSIKIFIVLIEPTINILAWNFLKFRARLL
jgi:hypothetical protein